MRAHIFDMDGTLLPRTSAPALLAAALGRHGTLAELERRFSSGTATAAEFGRALHESAILNPEDKPLLAARFCAEHRLDMRDAVAYGDSMSDVFLFKEVGWRVSVNGDHHIADLADVVIEGADLMAAYTAARQWCDRRSR
jgi:phosphoserine phosphatase